MKNIFNSTKLVSPPQNSDLVYHYCSLKAFIDIFKSNTIRLYDLTTMNDPSELELKKFDFAKLLQEYYIETIDNRNVESEANTHKVDIYLKIFRDLFSLENSSNILLILAFCLSEVEDGLVQWRLYGDEGRGVSLGFDRHILETYAKDNKIDFCNIEYQNEFDKWLEERVKNAIEEIKSIKSDDNLVSRIYDLIVDFYSKIFKYKKQAFSFEHEVRLVRTLQFPKDKLHGDTKEFIKLKSLNFDTNRNMIRVYEEVPLTHLGLKTITLGPQNDNNQDIINLLLSRYIQTDEIKIYKSYIPYRD